MSLSFSFARVSAPVAVILAGAIIGFAGALSHDNNALILAGLVIAMGTIFGAAVYADSVSRGY